MSPSPHLRLETGSVPEMLFCSYLEFQTMDKVHKHLFRVYTANYSKLILFDLKFRHTNS
jgi:hypothetical protein